MNMLEKKSFEALRKGDFRKVKDLIQSGADVNVRDDRGHTLLMEAAWHDNPWIVEQLLKSGADVNAQDVYGRTPLSEAISAGNSSEVVRILIKYGAKVSVEGGLLFRSLYFEKTGVEGFDIFRTLLIAGADISIKMEPWRTPLMEAAWNGDVGAIFRLTKFEKRIDARDSSGRTALMWAAISGDLCSIRCLLRLGADVKTSDQGGRTALWYAIARRNKEAFRVLLEAIKTKDSPGFLGIGIFSLAAEVGDPDILRELLEATPLQRERNCVGMTPLLWAVIKGHTEATRILLNFGANPREKTLGGVSAVDLAKREGYFDIAEIISAAS